MPTLNWIGKEAVVNHHQQVPFHLLKDVPELTCGNPGNADLIAHIDRVGVEIYARDAGRDAAEHLVRVKGCAAERMNMTFKRKNNAMLTPLGVVLLPESYAATCF